MEDAARAEIFELVVRIDPAAHGKVGLASVLALDLHVHVLARFDAGDTGDGEGFASVETQALGILMLAKLKWQHAHADKVGAVDALEALGDHRADPEQHRAL